MKKIHEVIFINAPKEKVWDTMLEDATYREWTKSFNPGSYYKGDWSEGSKILFLGPGLEGGVEGGMVSHIKENKPYEFISIVHDGMVSNGIEDTESDFVKEWKGAHENYTFTSKDGGTELVVDSDVSDTEFESMGEMWKKALLVLKEIAEK